MTAQNQTEGFVEALVTLEVEPEQLRRDPLGEQWLPSTLRDLAQRDPSCAAELEAFVEMELALFDVHEPSDAFFTHTVMDSLPEADTVDDQRRTWILASAYALAIGVAYLLLGPLLGSGQISQWLEPIHSWSGGYALSAGSVWAAVGVLSAACAIVALPTRSRVQA